LALVGALALCSSGCFTAGYLAQAASGEYDILRAARPLPAVVGSPETPRRLQVLLAKVPDLKAFGQRHGLKPTRNYDRYADLHRGAAVWVVQACAPLSFDVRRWQFLLVGSVPYLGFFDEAAARRYAGEVAKAEALDVEVRTATAFSTLGWFRDPVLSTMIPQGEEALGELANVVLHESVHATVYVPNQSAFSESFASFVADHLTEEWLAGRSSAEARAWVDRQERIRGRAARLHLAYQQLDELYRSSLGDEGKRAQKALLLAAVVAELKLVRPINNATLAGMRTYATGSAVFERLLGACGGKWPRVLAAVGALTAADFQSPQQEDLDPVIDRLAQRECATPRSAP
jgi:predicted aminopeptidase